MLRVHLVLVISTYNKCFFFFFLNNYMLFSVITFDKIVVDVKTGRGQVHGESERRSCQVQPRSYSYEWWSHRSSRDNRLLSG